jgi:hypothetical protein
MLIEWMPYHQANRVDAHIIILIEWIPIHHMLII